MKIECPNCGVFNDIDGDDLPELACDENDFECRYCGHEFKIGWYATAESR